MEGKNYRVELLPVAFQDLQEIDDYISLSLENPTAALTLLDKMQKALDQLKAFPYSGSEVKDTALADKGYRKMVVDNYIIFHIVKDEEKTVYIMRVIYGAREYQNLL